MTVANLVSDAALVIWCGQSLASTLAVAGYGRGLPQPEIPGVEPNVAVILPVRGADCLSRLLPLLRAQQYKNYRIIASVESADDPAFSMPKSIDAQSWLWAPLAKILHLKQFANLDLRGSWHGVGASLHPVDRLVEILDLPHPVARRELPRPLHSAVLPGKATRASFRVPLSPAASTKMPASISAWLNAPMSAKS
jgi:hypothetical protein